MPIEPLCIPSQQGLFLENATRVLRKDERIVGIAVAGSLAESRADAFSDVDMIVAVEPLFHDEIMRERHAIAESLGHLVAAFTGEHVGEPRLRICLYDNPVLHVDLKFVALPDAAPVVDTPKVLWERDGRLGPVVKQRNGAYPSPNAQWIEDRFWVWVHYFAGKVGRGELFEAIEMLSFLRIVVLAPLGLAARGMPASGVRRLEEKAPELASELTATLASHDAESLWKALDAAVALYRRFRPANAGTIEFRTETEVTAMRYVKGIRELA